MTSTPRAALDPSSPLRPMPGTGMGSRLVIGSGSGVDHLDPFVALIHDDVPPHAFFPTHPHRGVEILTYGISGALAHEDTLGNAGTVVAGGVERNLFGRGFAHSEQPVGGVPYRGFQLFILLSPADREMAPDWQLLAPDEVPEVTGEGTRVRVIAGTHDGTTSPVTLRNPTQYLDVHLDPGCGTMLDVPAGLQGLAYVVAGTGIIGTPPVVAGPHQRLVLGAGDVVHARADDASDAPFRFVVIAGRPITGPA